MNPHFFVLEIREKAVNENKQQITGAFSDFSVNKLRINHYWSRDIDFMDEKLKRRKKLNGDVKVWIKFEKDMNKVYDPILAKP